MTMQKITAQLRNPFFLMGLVVLSLALKAGIKAWTGTLVHSTMLVGDGVHNIGDMVESIVVICVLYISTRPRSQEYSMGRGNAEFFATFAVAIMLMGIAFDFIRRSLGGLAQSFHIVDVFFKACGSVVGQIPLVGDWLVSTLTVGELSPPEVSGPLFPYLLGITVFSIVVSLIMSHYQIAVGKLTGHAIVEAAGQEMKVDSRIELVTLVGIISQKVFPGAPFLEYGFALVIALVVLHTALDLFMDAMRALLAKSIGAEIDEELRRMCLCVPGISSVVSLGTFRVGPLAVVKVTLTTMLDGAVPLLTDAVEKQLKQYVVSQGFVECQADIMFKKPTPNRHRIAYAVTCSKQGQIETVAATTSAATHIAVADIEFGEIDRATLHPVPANLSEFLARKRVRVLYVFDVDTQRQTWDNTAVVLESSASYIPAAVGLELG